MKIAKFLIPTALSITIGLYLGKLIYNNYENKLELEQTFNSSNTVYFLQQGVYSTKESMSENASGLTDYIYVLDEDKYRVFIGITTDKEVVEKIKSIYADKGMDIYAKEEVIDDSAFIEKLKEYDKLIIDSADTNEILNYENQIMKEYEVSYSGK